MSETAERALWRLERSLGRVRSLAWGAAYGLRVASKRIGDLAAKDAGFTTVSAKSAEELQRLADALAEGEECLTEAVVLAMAEHFREYLRGVLGMEHALGLPATPAEAEALAGTPGALKDAPFLFSLFLALAGASARDGQLDREAMRALGRDEMELAYPGGKMKLFREGDRVALTEKQVDEMAEAILWAARSVKARLEAA